MTASIVLTLLVSLSCLTWLYLAFAHHGFWRRREFLPQINDVKNDASLPSIMALTPARNEETVIQQSLRSTLRQDYQGEYRLTLINDNSDDDTQDIAAKVIQDEGKTQMSRIIQAAPLKTGWSGKLWALHNGLDAIPETQRPDYYWLTDADITHSPDTLARLAGHARQNDLAMASLMVTLNCKSFWEKRIIPAFIYYFQLLYPFSATAQETSKIAGGAGGCIVLRRDALEAIGGIESLKDALIDDCALAAAVKAKGYKIWLGHGMDSLSIRQSAGLKDLWNMVIRTAFTQLNFSYLQLLGAIFGMFIVYLMPVIAVIMGAVFGHLGLGVIGAAAWGIMAVTYVPTIRAYGRPTLESITLPFTAILFMAMTIHSAWLHMHGTHSGWRGRIYGRYSSHKAQ